MDQPACHLLSQIIISVEVLLIDCYCLNIHCWLTLLTAGEVWAAGFRTVCAAYIWLPLLAGTDGMSDLSDDFLCSPDNLPCSKYVVIQGLFLLYWNWRVWPVCWKLVWCFELMGEDWLHSRTHSSYCWNSIQYQAILLGYGNSPTLALNLLPPLIWQFPKKKKKKHPADRNGIAH